MRIGNLTLPLVALLALAACEQGGSQVQQTPEPTPTTERASAGGTEGGAGTDGDGAEGGEDAQ